MIKAQKSLFLPHLILEKMPSRLSRFSILNRFIKKRYSRATNNFNLAFKIFRGYCRKSLEK
jgi:hypothetical protein